jgi:NADH-quinone oxidoreductase subunit G
LPGEARSGWRVLRALGAALGFSSFDSTEIGDVRARIGDRIASPVAAVDGVSVPKMPTGLVRIATVPIYKADAVLRRSPALQATPLANKPQIALNPADFLPA